MAEAYDGYPEVAAGGYTRVDGTIAFYTRVNALVFEAGPSCVVVDLGAGRGAANEDQVPYRRHLRVLQGRAQRVIGLDVDPVVLENPIVDEAHHFEPGAVLPVIDGQVDVVVSDFTAEHIDDPAWFAREVERILRPGGWACIRTPNKWGYIGVGAQIVPNRLHVAALRRLQPYKRAQDTFPTRYRMNTRRALHGWFPEPRFSEVVVLHQDGDASYAGASRALQMAFRALAAVTPQPLKPLMAIYVRKAP